MKLLNAAGVVAMTLSRFRPVRSAILTVSVMVAFSSRTALAQFSNRDGYAPDGSYRVQVELTPYLWLPALDATMGLKRPPGADISINRSRPTIADLVTTLNGAFVGYGLLRYGPWSAELDVDWVSASQKRTFPALPNIPAATLKTNGSLVYVSPGIGYQLIPDFAPDKVSLDLRAGFSYFDASGSAAFAQSRFGGASVDYSFVVPWLGFRGDYYPSPHWRIDLAAAITGLGVDSALGWNARLGVSYLITRWFDVTVGYGAVGVNRSLSLRADGSSRSLHLIAYGPVVALGFRF